MDMLKIDVQGYEREVFANGLEKLAQCVVVHTEVSFVPLYRDMPTIGDVDSFLRRCGFIPHTFQDIKKWIIAPCVIGGNPRKPLNQLLEADMVYVRDFRHPEAMTDGQLKHLALISHCVYGSYDHRRYGACLFWKNGALTASWRAICKVCMKLAHRANGPEAHQTPVSGTLEAGVSPAAFRKLENGCCFCTILRLF